MNLVTFENFWVNIGNIYIYFRVSVTPSDVMVCNIIYFKCIIPKRETKHVKF